MKIKSLLAPLLSLPMILASCGIITINRGGAESETSAESEISLPTYRPGEYPVATETDGLQIAQDRLSGLPDADLEGQSVFFAAATETGALFGSEEGIYSQAVLKRNQLVDEKYNTRILILRENSEVLRDKVRAADRAEEYYADFVVLPYVGVGGYYADGYLRNLSSLSFAELDDECYDGEAMAQLTFGGFVAGAVGDATDQPEHYACLFFNKTLAGRLGTALDYRSIYDGEFTWESLLTLLKTMPEGTISLVGDDGEQVISDAFFSTGQTYLASDGEGGLHLACDTEASVSLIGVLKQLLPMLRSEAEIGAGTAASGETEAETATLKGREIFLAGEAAVCFGNLGMMSELANCGFRWEALPLPKLSADEPVYSTAVTDRAPVITALASAENVDTVGYVLRALHTASFGYVRYEFYRYAEAEAVTGVNTLDMIDLICENPVYDHASMFGGAYAGLRNGTTGAFLSAVQGERDFSYYLSRNASRLNSYLNGLK